MEIFRIPPYLLGIVLGIWLLVFLYTRKQFDKVKEYTLELIVEEYHRAIRSNPELTLDKFYQILLVKWEQWLTENIRVIPHKTEFWPMPAKPDYVRQRMNFTPEWVGAYLKLKGFDLEATAEQKEKINRIVSLAPQNRMSEDAFPEHPPRNRRKDEQQ